MNKKYSSIIISICLLFLLPLNVYSSSIKEDYELQERCAKYCDEWFKKEYGDGITENKNGINRFTYSNHYNRKLNKCFLLLSFTWEPKNKEKEIMVIKNLMDINEKKYTGQ